MRMKEGILKYVKIMKRLFVALSVVAIPALMVCLVFAFSGFMIFAYIAPAVGVLYLVVYGVYALKVSMGTVVGIEVTDQMLHIKTKRKVFSYDVRSGCVELKITAKKFIGTFRTQTSQDKFVFYRHILFTPYSIEQFTEDDIRLFYPQIDEMEI